MNANTISTGVIDVKNNEILLLSDCTLSSSTGRTLEKIIGLGTFGPHIEAIKSYTKSITLNGPIMYPQQAFPFSLEYMYNEGISDSNNSINGNEESGQEVIPKDTTNAFIYNCFDLYSWLVDDNPFFNRNNIVEYLLGMYVDNIGISFGDDVTCNINMSTKMPYQVSLEPNISHDFMNFKITNDPRITTNQYISNKLKMTWFLIKPQYFIHNDITQQFVITNCKFNINFEYINLENLIPGWEKPECDFPYIERSYPIVPRILTGITMDAEYDFLMLKMSRIHKLEVGEMQENLIARLECPANALQYPPIDFITIYDVDGEERPLGFITLLINRILKPFGHTNFIKWTIKDCNLQGINASGMPSYHLSYGSSIIFNPLGIMSSTSFPPYTPEEQKDLQEE